MGCGGGGAAGGGPGEGWARTRAGGAEARAGGGRSRGRGARAPWARWAGRGPRAAGRAGRRSCPSGAERVGTAGRWASWEKSEAFGGRVERSGVQPPAPRDCVQTIPFGAGILGRPFGVGILGRREGAVCRLEEVSGVSIHFWEKLPDGVFVLRGGRDLPIR